MTISDAARFAKDLTTDKDLIEKVKAKASGLASLVELGKTHGYNFTLDEIKQVVRSSAKRDLSDDDLEAVAGGKAQPAATAQPSDAAKAERGLPQVVAMDSVSTSQASTVAVVIVVV